MNLCILKERKKEKKTRKDRQERINLKLSSYRNRTKINYAQVCLLLYSNNDMCT